MTRKTTSMAESAVPPRRKSIKTILTVAMVTLVAFAVVVFAWLPAKMAQAEPAITISGSIGAHDPSRIIKDGNTYYVYATGYNIPSLTSTDRIHWTQGKVVLPNGTPAWARKAVPGNDGHDIWAPDVIYNNGLFYLYYAIAGNKYYTAIGLVTSPTLNPNASNYKWTDRGEVIGTNTSDQYAAIDPAPYFDTSGNMWLSWGSGYSFSSTEPSIFEIQLNKNTGLRADNVLHAVLNGHDEASYVYHHGSYYYLFWNTGGCCYGTASTYVIHVARSTLLTGPYMGSSGSGHPSNIFLASHDNVHGPGQIGILDEGGTSYYTYHYYNASGNPVLGEGVLNWSSSGWPIAN
jgi:arabinan endo-1,5-alpha-L-arabinosidase